MITVIPRMSCWYLQTFEFWFPYSWHLGAETCRNFICDAWFLVVLWPFVGYCNYFLKTLFGISSVFNHFWRTHKTFWARCVLWLSKLALTYKLEVTDGISDHTLAVLTGSFYGFPRPSRQRLWECHKLGLNQFPPHPITFIIYSSYHCIMELG
jgi:hypothetical protein